jgi:peptidoglycan/LPS O-acetylase OafA/YrhL
MSTTSIPGKPRRIELDFVRGIAILMVMTSHFWKAQTGIFVIDEFSQQMSSWGGKGVELFFVLSGFLVGGLLVKEYKDTGRVNATRFLVRRIFKIWPAFYFLLLFHAVTRRHPINTFLFQNLFHLQNYLGTSIKQTWTLSIEEHFYIFLAISLGILTARHLSIRGLFLFCGCVCVVSTGLRFATVYWGNMPGAQRWTQNRLDSLMFGVILALLYHVTPRAYAAVTQKAWPLLLAALGGLAWLIWVPSETVVMYTVGFSLITVAFGAFLLLTMEYSKRIRDFVPYRIIAWFGVYSYGLYLWHSAVRDGVRNTVQHFPRSLWWPVGLGLQIGSASVIAVIATRIVEWPFLRWREHIPYLRDDRPLLAAAETIKQEPATVIASGSGLAASPPES